MSGILPRRNMGGQRKLRGYYHNLRSCLSCRRAVLSFDAGKQNRASTSSARTGFFWGVRALWRRRLRRGFGGRRAGGRAVAEGEAKVDRGAIDLGSESGRESCGERVCQ